MWQVIRISAIAERDEGWRKEGESFWPERWPVEELAKIRDADATVWEASYQQRPTIGGGCWFDPNWLQFYKELTPKHQSQLNIYMLCDPALSKDKKADYTTIWVFGTGEDRNFYWLELIRARMDPDERASEIFRLHRKYRPINLGYEEYGLQSDIVSLRQKMEREHYRFTITELGRAGIWHNLSKADRIRSLITVAKNGRLWLPDPDVRGRDDRVVKATRDFINREWAKYPAVDYDDILDVMSRINDPGMNITFPMVSQNEIPDTHWAGATWMSA